MLQPLNIRPATPRDLGTMAGFQVCMAMETEDKILDGGIVQRAMERVLEDPTLGRYFVAERGGQLVGSLMLTYEWSDWRDAMWWWIQSVYVPMEARRTGVYRALYAEVQDLAKADPLVQGIRLYVEVDNKKAQETYEALGMRQAPYLIYQHTGTE